MKLADLKIPQRSSDPLGRYLENAMHQRALKAEQYLRVSIGYFLLQGYRFEELERVEKPHPFPIVGDEKAFNVRPKKKRSRFRLALRRFIFGKRYSSRLVFNKYGVWIPSASGNDTGDAQ